MTKIIILSYFYPPANFAGSYRMKAWAENLHKFGYYPIVVTRHWAENETDYTAISENDTISKEEYPTHTIYRLPYKGSLRDRLVNRFGQKMKIPGKILSFFQLVRQNYFISSCPFNNLYFFTRDILQSDSEIKLILTSGRPFIHFKFAWHLKKEFPHLKWVADYRDPWNTCPNIKKSFKLQILKLLEYRSEIKWLKNSSLITTTSDGFRNGLIKLHRSRNIKIITNGFDEFVECKNDELNDNLSIAYIGSLYPEQKIEVFLNGYLKFLKLVDNSKVMLNFYGLGLNKRQAQRIENKMVEYKYKACIFEWLEKNELLANACKSDFLLISGLKERKGTYTAKLFDYFSLKKNIILSPSDNDIIEDTIKSTNAGVVLDTEDEVYNWLSKTYAGWQKNRLIPYLGDINLISEFKYENQVKKLATHLDKLFT